MGKYLNTIPVATQFSEDIMRSKGNQHSPCTTMRCEWPEGFLLINTLPGKGIIRFLSTAFWTAVSHLSKHIAMNH